MVTQFNCSQIIHIILIGEYKKCQVVMTQSFVDLIVNDTKMANSKVVE